MPARTLRKTNARNRAALDPSVPKQATPAIIQSIAATAADTIQITFDTRVFKNKQPAFTAGAGAAETVTSAQEISATVLEVAFSGDVQGTKLYVNAGDMSIRTPSGGSVSAGSYAIPTFP